MRRYSTQGKARINVWLARTLTTKKFAYVEVLPDQDDGEPLQDGEGGVHGECVVGGRGDDDQIVEHQHRCQVRLGDRQQVPLYPSPRGKYSNTISAKNTSNYAGKKGLL